MDEVEFEEAVNEAVDSVIGDPVLPETKVEVSPIDELVKRIEALETHAKLVDKHILSNPGFSISK